MLCVATVHTAADEISIVIFFKFFDVKKINEIVLTSNKLNNFAGLVTSGLGPNAARSPPVVPCCS
jgi:hypothetical protein